MLFISNPDGEDPRFYSIDVSDNHLTAEYAVKPVYRTTLVYEDRTYTVEYLCLVSFESQEDLDRFSYYIHAYEDPINNFGKFFASRGFGECAIMQAIAVDPDGDRKLFTIRGKSDHYTKGNAISVIIELDSKSDTIGYIAPTKTNGKKALLELATYLSTLNTFEQVVLSAMLLKASTVTEYKPEGVIVTPVKDLINQNIIDYINGDKFMQTWEN